MWAYEEKNDASKQFSHPLAQAEGALESSSCLT